MITPVAASNIARLSQQQATNQIDAIATAINGVREPVASRAMNSRARGKSATRPFLGAAVIA